MRRPQGPPYTGVEAGATSFPYYLRYRARRLSLAAPSLFPIASGAALAYSETSGSSPSELRLYGVLRSSPRIYPDRISRIWAMRSLVHKVKILL
jgi:hypothetical protein